MSGLRERKIAQTKVMIQHCAFRLFTERGYAQTTVEQIAEAAGVSPRTFFRYFRTKEAVILYDSVDAMVMEAFRQQPPGLPIIRAMRNGIREAYGGLSPVGRQQELQRFALLGAIPPVRDALFAEAVSSIDLFAGVIAEKVGKPAHEVAVRNVAGAIVGVLAAVILQACKEPSTVVLERDFDKALERLEAGLGLELIEKQGNHIKGGLYHASV